MNGKRITLDDKMIFRLGITLLLIGLFIVWVGQEALFPETRPIAQIKNAIGTLVTVEGTVGQVREIPGGYILTITDPSGSIKGVLFDKTSPIHNTTQIRATGEVIIYKNKPELRIFSVKPLIF